MNSNTDGALILSEPLPLDQNAAALYIASLPAEAGRRTQAQALRVIAQVKIDVARMKFYRSFLIVEDMPEAFHLPRVFRKDKTFK